MFVTCQAELLARLRHRPRVLGDRSHVPAKGIMLGGTHGNTDCANRQLVPANPTYEGVAFGIRRVDLHACQCGGGACGGYCQHCRDQNVC